METLEDPGVRSRFCERIARLDPGVTPRWGRMSAHQMICHLTDSFRVASGEKHASPATNLFQRTIVKWIVLYTPLVWPKGIPTRPEVEQGRGGTLPSDWQRDCEDLRNWILTFADRTAFGAHPTFGKMSHRVSWGYRHVDHHFRQFGV